MNRVELGREGELAALQFFLKDPSSKCLGRNLRTDCAQVDLLLEWRARLWLVEVKTRRGKPEVPDFPLLTRKQRERLYQASQCLESEFKRPVGILLSFVSWDPKRRVFHVHPPRRILDS